MKNRNKLYLGVTAITLIVLLASGCAGAKTSPPTQSARAPQYSLPDAAAEEEWAAAPAESEPAADVGESFSDWSGAPTQQSRDGLTPPNGNPYHDTFFENYGVNPFIDTDDDHYSTFALDVDTGSYTIARSYLNDGSLPDQDGVRVEEFVNYFDQGYDYPEEGQAFALYMDGAPSPFTNTESYQMLRVGVQGYAVAPEDRPDVALTFVIDVSGSMDMDNRLGLVKDSLNLLVKELRSTDTVAIVVYGSRASTILKPTEVRNFSTIINAIDDLQPGGSTNAAEGIEEGYRMALKGFNPEGINRVILCSDGVANVGDTSQGDIWEHVASYASEGITLTTIGFGMDNYNDVLMEQLADNGNGFYAYVDDIKEAERLFTQNLTSTLQVIAMDAKIQVDFNPEVVARYRLVGYENRDVADEDFRNDEVDAGEIGAGLSVTALYEVKLLPGTEGEVARVYLRWEDPDTHEVSEINESFYSDEFAESFYDASRYFQRAVLVAEFAEVLRDSYWAKPEQMPSILENTQALNNDFDFDEDQVELVGLMEEADSLLSRSR